MRKSIREFMKIFAKILPSQEPIYEFGSFLVKGQEEVADLRPLFPNKKYVGTDMREGNGVDAILDLHNINLSSNSVGTVLCLDTLEHVEYPRKAMKEIYRILKPNGIVVISSAMKFPIHNFPEDYWRFTPEAFRSLLKEFNSSYIKYLGEDKFPNTVIGIGFKGEIELNKLDLFKTYTDEWKIHHDAMVEDPIREKVKRFILSVVRIIR